MDASDRKTSPEGAIETRWAELVTALLIMLLAALVIGDSIRVGAGWGAEGPQAGYFPNIVGIILMLCGAWIAGGTLWRWRRLQGDVFVTMAGLKPVLAMLLPTIGYVVLVWLIGIYVSSAIYIAGFMLLQGKYKWLPTLAVSVGVPVGIFLLFEIWFLVPLPKGPLENLLGY